MKVIHDIRIDWQSTPALWTAYRDGLCGCGEHDYPRGWGKTPIVALADLLAQEMDAEERAA